MQWSQELSNILFVWFQCYLCYKRSDSTRLRGIWNLKCAEILQLIRFSINPPLNAFNAMRLEYPHNGDLKALFTN